MTHPEDGRADNQPDMTPQTRLRAELLISGLYDWVPLAEVETVIISEDLAKPRTAQQDLALRTIRSLIEDGLMQIGDLPNPGEQFSGWDLSIDAAMERVYELFVRRYEERASWELVIWLGLTPSGEQVARTLRDQRTD